MKPDLTDVPVEELLAVEQSLIRARTNAARNTLFGDLVPVIDERIDLVRAELARRARRQEAAQ